MIRRAFTMRLKPGSLAEYKHHHDHIWQDLVAEIERSGIARITTFQRDLDLFLISEISDDDAWQRLWTSEVHRRWAQVMEPLMHLRDDGTVDAGELTEIFHIVTSGNGQPAVSVIEAMVEAAPPSQEPPRAGAAEPSTDARAEDPSQPPESASEPPVESANGAPPAKALPAETPAAKKRSAGKKSKPKPDRRPKPRVAVKATRKPASKKSRKKPAAKKAAKKKSKPKSKPRAKKKKAARHR